MMEVIEFLWDAWWEMKLWGRIVTFFMLLSLVGASRKTILERKPKAEAVAREY